MSEKKSKEIRRTLKLPKYESAKQLNYIREVCKICEFDAEVLTSFILADFLLAYEIAVVENGNDYRTCFYSYLESVVKRHGQFIEFMKKHPDVYGEVKNG